MTKGYFVFAPRATRSALRLAGALLFALNYSAEAQQTGRIWRIGYLDPSTASTTAGLVESFRQEMRTLGWIEGKNIVIEYRFGDAHLLQPKTLFQAPPITFNCRHFTLTGLLGEPASFQQRLKRECELRRGHSITSCSDAAARLAAAELEAGLAERARRDRGHVLQAHPVVCIVQSGAPADRVQAPGGAQIFARDGVEAVAAAEAVALVRLVIDLAEECRGVVSRRKFARRQHWAAVAGLTENAVRQQLFRARRRLTEELWQKSNFAVVTRRGSEIEAADLPPHHVVLRAGASGFVLKDDPPEQLIGAIRTVAAGDALLSPTITRRVIQEFARRPRPSPPKELDELSDRELDVFRLIARGLSNGEIAQELYISETTVKTHVTHILQKLHLRDRVQAVVLAYQTGAFEAETQ